ncbi:uncharacterized protein KGF55_002838 [Candida pseudojiufengensis]|uniref:uncharacterized protein n=1 Tax=Candida pseudojiufengensis TaxID=497109 RepID=UPI002224F5A5|nr:uncharacterized protein KGF55_002838 [Candida pseudojiufengensis]KAI5963046.1 hypothetical protein KGF55_002838 [Candida pseudojiufengensis]
MAPKSSTSSGPYKDKEKVYSKMASYPWWPGFITPEEYIPKQVKKSKKKNTPYCVIFIPDGDFYWATEKGLKKFKDGPPPTTTNTSSKKSNKNNKVNNNSNNLEDFKDLKFLKKRLRPKTSNADISEANVAAENLNFDEFIKIFQSGDDDNELDAVNEPPAGEAPVEEENNEEEEKGEEDGNEQDGENDENDDKEEDTKLTSRATRSRRQSPSKTTTSTKATPTQSKRKSPTNIEKISKKPKLEEIESKSVDEETAQPATKEEDKYQQLYFCRIKLQRSLIQRTSPTDSSTKKESSPTADELSMARLILHRLTNFPVTKELLKSTKIHKVLKAIIKDPTLELPESFKLHERSREILQSWDPIIRDLLSEKGDSNDSNGQENNNNGKTEKNSKLLSIKNNNGANGANDESEFSGVEQSLHDIDDEDGNKEESDEKSDEKLKKDSNDEPKVENSKEREVGDDNEATKENEKNEEEEPAKEEEKSKVE